MMAVDRPPPRRPHSLISLSDRPQNTHRVESSICRDDSFPFFSSPGPIREPVAVDGNRRLERRFSQPAHGAGARSLINVPWEKGTRRWRCLPQSRSGLARQAACRLGRRTGRAFGSVQPQMLGDHLRSDPTAQPPVSLPLPRQTPADVMPQRRSRIPTRSPSFSFSTRRSHRGHVYTQKPPRISAGPLTKVSPQTACPVYL